MREYETFDRLRALWASLEPRSAVNVDATEWFWVNESTGWDIGNEIRGRHSSMGSKWVVSWGSLTRRSMTKWTGKK